MASRTAAIPMHPLVIERKVKGGKLFRLRVTGAEDTLSVQLTGDFFLEPEEGIEVIERCLPHCFRLPDQRMAELRLSEEIAKAQIRISGFEVKDIIEALWEARS
ncbi:MAG: hypothetical protein LUO85_03785 [Methanomassiliicoccales archaeon]|nr:hypothetical protein [Methanomassiliicoccales archaeon]